MDKKIKISATVVFICAIICVIPVMLLICTLPDSQRAVFKDQICLPSESGSINCGKTTELLSDYLKGIIVEEYANVKRIDEKKQQDYLDKNRGRLMDAFDLEMKPAAKLTGKEQPSLSDDDIGKDMVAVREWHHADGLSDTSGFFNYGIRYRKGRLIVPVDGTYFIYSNLDFFEECTHSTGMPNVQDINNPIKHGIFNFNILHDEEKELVSNVQPHTICANGYYNSYSSYVSSTVELKAGDEISVKVVERASRLRLASVNKRFLITYIFQIRLEGERYLQCGNKRLKEPSGHLTAAFRRVSRNQSYGEERTDTVIHWDSQPDVSFISEDVEYNKGQIKVSEGGFYFIYSSILINLTTIAVNIGKMYRFCLYVCANKNGYERTLLSSYKHYNITGRNDVTDFAKYDATSLSIRGNVFITKEESIYIKITDKNSLIQDSVGNTFGIMPME